MHNKLFLTAALLAAIGATPAKATLQLAIDVNGSIFTCSDGETSCDQSGGANNLLTIDTSIGGAFVQITLAQSTFGAVNTLQLSSSNIVNDTAGALNIKLLASDTNFVPPVSDIRDFGLTDLQPRRRLRSVDASVLGRRRERAGRQSDEHARDAARDGVRHAADRS